MLTSINCLLSNTQGSFGQVVCAYDQVSTYGLYKLIYEIITMTVVATILELKRNVHGDVP